MYCRVVSLLLLPCVLLPQSTAVLAHCHCDGGTGKGFGRSHFHTNTPSTHDGPTHSHDVCGCQHRHDEGDNESRSPDVPPVNSPDDSVPEPGHDHDVIYVDHVDVLLSERSPLDDEAAPLACWMTPEIHPPTRLLASTPTNPDFDIGSALLCNSGCPLFVRQLTLII